MLGKKVAYACEMYVYSSLSKNVTATLSPYLCFMEHVKNYGGYLFPAIKKA